MNYITTSPIHKSFWSRLNTYLFNCVPFPTFATSQKATFAIVSVSGDFLSVAIFITAPIDISLVLSATELVKWQIVGIRNRGNHLCHHPVLSLLLFYTLQYSFIASTAVHWSLMYIILYWCKLKSDLVLFHEEILPVLLIETSAETLICSWASPTEIFKQGMYNF